jgi:hypothetical protein
VCLFWCLLSISLDGFFTVMVQYQKVGLGEIVLGRQVVVAFVARFGLVGWDLYVTSVYLLLYVQASPRSPLWNCIVNPLLVVEDIKCSPTITHPSSTPCSRTPQFPFLLSKLTQGSSPISETYLYYVFHSFIPSRLCTNL